MSALPLESGHAQRGHQCPLSAKSGHLPIDPTDGTHNVERTNRDRLIEFGVGRGAGTMNFRIWASAERR